jgi:hypothetical protein
MKCGSRGWSGKDPSNQATNDRSGNAEDRGHKESQVLHPGQNRARAQADNETDYDRPNDV